MQEYVEKGKKINIEIAVKMGKVKGSEEKILKDGVEVSVKKELEEKKKKIEEESEERLRLRKEEWAEEEKVKRREWEKYEKDLKKARKEYTKRGVEMKKIADEMRKGRKSESEVSEVVMKYYGGYNMYDHGRMSQEEGVTG